MEQFDVLNFFVYQKILYMLYMEIFIKYKDKVTDFFSILLEHNYAGKFLAKWCFSNYNYMYACLLSQKIN